MKNVVFFALSALIVLSSSCSDRNKTPAQVTDKCFKSLAKGDFDSASKLFPKPEQDLEWAKTYFGRQDLAKIFGVTINDTVILGDRSIVTYTPEKILLYDFDGRNAALLSRKDGAWKIDLRESLQFMSGMGISGKSADLASLMALYFKASEKLGKSDPTLDQILNAEDEPSLKQRKASWAKQYDYDPQGASRGGETGVIFYSKECYDPGVYAGASKTRFFLTDGSKVFLTIDLSKIMMGGARRK